MKQPQDPAPQQEISGEPLCHAARSAWSKHGSQAQLDPYSRPITRAIWQETTPICRYHRKAAKASAFIFHQTCKGEVALPAQHMANGPATTT